MTITRVIALNVEKNKKDDNLKKYLAIALIIKFLKYNQTEAIVLSFRPWDEQYVMNALEDLQSIGTGIISYEDMRDSERVVSAKYNATRKVLDKQIMIRLSTRLEK